jgi:hypothetical protein
VGKIYIYNIPDTCLLHFSAPGYKDETKVFLRINRISTCPEYPGYEPEGSARQYPGPPRKARDRKFRVTVQYDPVLVSRDDVSFVVSCDGYDVPFLDFRYTVKDDLPVQLVVSFVSTSCSLKFSYKYPETMSFMVSWQGSSDRKNFEVVIREGFSPQAPSVNGPVPIGSLLLIQIMTLSKDPRLRIQAIDCEAQDGQVCAFFLVFC